MLPINEIYALYDKFNWRYFNSKLPRCKIECSDKKTTNAGWYNSGTKTLSLSSLVLSDRLQDLKDTLIHEMIHVAQDTFRVNERAHGPFFSAYMKKINDGAKGEVLVTVKHHIFAIKDFEETSMLGRIKKLLALSESPNENEAYAAAKKAQALMAVHGVKQGDLSTVEIGTELDEPLVSEVIEPGSGIPAWKFILLIAIANVNYCKALKTTNLGLRVLGNKIHVEICRSYYQYFCQLIVSEAAKHKGQGAVFLNRFREGMAQGIGDRLKEQFDLSNAMQSSQSSELCLADQYMTEMNHYVNMLCPIISSGSGSSRQANPSATRAGRSAGANASVAKHVVAGSKRLSGAK